MGAEQSVEAAHGRHEDDEQSSVHPDIVGQPQPARERILVTLSDLSVKGKGADVLPELKVSVDATFPLDEAPEGHKYLEAGKSKGKVLFKI